MRKHERRFLFWALRKALAELDLAKNTEETRQLWQHIATSFDLLAVLCPSRQAMLQDCYERLIHGYLFVYDGKHNVRPKKG
jgi:hypothetical protein